MVNHELKFGGCVGLRRILDRVRDRLGAIVIAILVLGAIYLLPSGLPEALNGPAFVIDGDSLEIVGRRVRLYGIDAPERDQECRRDGRNWACGQDAGVALRRKINGRAVNCEPIEFDQYDRILARCRVGGEDLNAWLVRNGWAVSFGSYRDDENEARSNRQGIWVGEFQRPWEWRRSHGI